jgi:hypothetical protein
MNITKVSDITTTDLAEYIRLADPSQTDLDTLGTLLAVAKEYVCQYTGRALIDLNDYNDIVIAVLVLVQDMWDNRTLYVDSSNANKVVESILGLHSVNLL